MNLAAITDINRIVHMINQGGYDIAPDKFYDKLLLDTIQLGQEHYVHLANTESYTLPAGTKRLQKRRWGGLTAHTVPLPEGMPPAADKTSMESISFTATQFGRYMEFTDRVNLDQIDPIIAHYTKQLGDVMARTLERYARETLLSAASKLFAANRTSVGEMRLTDRLAIADLRFAVLRMQRLLVKPLSNGFYNYICSPEYLFDLLDDALVVKYMEINQTTKELFNSGKPFPLFLINFIPTMLDEFYTPELDNVGEYYGAGVGSDEYALRVYAMDSSNNVYYGNLDDARRSVNNTVSYLSDGTAIPAGHKVTWDLTKGTLAVASFRLIGTDIHLTKVAASDGAVTTLKIVASGAAAGQINLADVQAMNWYQLPVHKGILYGSEALIKISVQGQDGVQTIIQPLGSAGTNDPLKQRQTIAAKINSIGYGLLRDEAVCVTFSVPSQAVATSGLTAQVIKVDNSVVGKTADDADDMLAYREYTVDVADITDGDLIK